MAIGEYLGAGSGVTKGLYHLNGNANDSSGNGNNGTATNVTWVAGRLGSQCASFTGGTIPTSYINFGNVINLTTGLTFSVWYRVVVASGIMVIGGKGYNGGIIFQAYLLYTNGTSLVGRITTGGGTDFTDITATSSVTSGVWSHAVLTYNGSNIYLYINGIQRGTSAKTGNLNSGQILVLGAQFNTSVLGHFDGFQGSIDECIIENRAWSASEVIKQYNYQKGRFGIL